MENLRKSEIDFPLAACRAAGSPSTCAHNRGIVSLIAACLISCALASLFTDIAFKNKQKEEAAKLKVRMRRAREREADGA